MTAKVIKELIVLGLVTFVVTLYTGLSDLVDILETSDQPLEDGKVWLNSFGLGLAFSAARLAGSAVVSKIITHLPIGGN